MTLKCRATVGPLQVASFKQHTKTRHEPKTSSLKAHSVDTYLERWDTRVLMEHIPGTQLLQQFCHVVAVAAITAQSCYSTLL